MPSYVITGVSKGLGWEFMKQISSDASNPVIGIVRDKTSTDKRVAEELGDRSNITILEADLTDYKSLENAATEAALITGGSLDYLFANAAYLPTWDAWDPIGVLSGKPKELDAEFHKLMDTNVLANIHLYSLFMPQILRGRVKKVVFISSGMADVDMVNNWDIHNGALYSASKATMNLINAKFSAQYKKEGVLFLSVCPGMVDTGKVKNPTPEELSGAGQLIAKFQTYAPGFKGPATPPEAIKDVLSVVEKSSVKNGDGGAFLSHLGSKQWL